MSKTDVNFEIDLEKVEESSARSHALSFPQTWASARIEAVLNAIGAVANWIWIALVLIIVGTVSMRYFVGGNTIAVEEIQWHLYAIGFLIGIGYAIIHDSHVRVDVVAANLRLPTRAVIEFLGIALIILPMVWIVVSYAIPMVQTAFERGERSSSPGGLGNRWAIRAVMILAFVYIGLAAFARLLRVAAYLYDRMGGRPATGALFWVLNLGLLAGVIVLAILPFRQVAQVFPPSTTEVGRAIAQSYGLRRLNVDAADCRFRPGFSPGPISAEDARTAPFVFGWQCSVSGINFSAADAGAQPGETIFGRPLSEGAEAAGAVLLQSRYNPVSGHRVPLAVQTDIRQAQP